MKTNLYQSLEKEMTMNENDVHNLAAALLRKHQVSEPPIDPEKIAEAEGLSVRFADFGARKDEIHGLFYAPDKIIYINKDDSVGEKLFTIAHELAHAQLHFKYAESKLYLPRLKREFIAKNPVSLNKMQLKMEAHADIFALDVCIPNEMLRRYIPVASGLELIDIFVTTEEHLQEALQRAWL